MPIGFLPFYIKENSPQKVTNTVTSEGGELVGESVKLICPPGAVYNSLSVCVTAGLFRGWRVAGRLVVGDG